MCNNLESQQSFTLEKFSEDNFKILVDIYFSSHPNLKHSVFPASLTNSIISNKYLHSVYFCPHKLSTR